MKATAVNTALDRGIVGSTVDASARAGVDADVAGARAGARSEALQALAQNRLSVSQAGVDYFMGAQTLEAQKLAQQQEALAQQLQANMIISGQESQMDALKAIYKALSAQLGGGSNQPGTGVNKPGQLGSYPVADFLSQPRYGRKL
jgi:hypothetical protein